MAIFDRAWVQLACGLAAERGEEGQSLAEFALIVALVALLCVASLAALKGGISKTLGSIAGSL
ncbi:MAG TPA: hypothetical protein VKV26_25625 [Dehalococcoidia bacterium]|nr:hypothetical protein [Dehalococcoidia bacterium]